MKGIHFAYGLEHLRDWDPIEIRLRSRRISLSGGFSHSSRGKSMNARLADSPLYPAIDLIIIKEKSPR